MPLHGKIVVIKRSGGDGTEFPLTATCLFGRKPDCDIRIQLPQVSKEHCRIDLNENKEIILTNLSSVNPTRVNGEVLQQSERLKHGDVITIIDRSFRFEYPPAPTPKKRSSKGGKSETFKVLQDQQLGDAVTTEGREKRISDVSKDPHLKDGTNYDKSQPSLEKSVELETKDDDGLPQDKTASPFNDLYQMIKQSLDVKTPRKSSTSLLQTPSSKFFTPKSVSVKRNVGNPVTSTEDKTAPRQDEAKIPPQADETAPESVKKQSMSFQVPSTETTTTAPESAIKAEASSAQKTKPATPLKLTTCEVIEQVSAETPKMTMRRRSKEVTPTEPAVTNQQAETSSVKTKRNSGKVVKVIATSKKRKSGELGADLSTSKMKRKRVSFGGHLTPELFDKRLPPNSPLQKGGTPRRSLCLLRPKQSLLRRASVIGLLQEYPYGPNRPSPSKRRTTSPKKSPSGKKASPKAANSAKKSPKSRSPSPKAASPAKNSPKSRSPSPKAATPAKKSPKPRSPSPKAATPAKKSPKSRSPSPKAATPAKKSPKSRSPSPKAATPAKKSPNTSLASKSPKVKTSFVKATSPATKSPKPTSSSPVRGRSLSRSKAETLATEGLAPVQTPTVRGRFSVSLIKTPSPVAEVAVTDQVPLVTVTPKVPLRRMSMKRSSRKTPSVLKSAVKVMCRRSGISRGSMKALSSWANIVKFGQTKPQVAAPAKKTVSKKTVKKTVPTPKTPARIPKGHMSTGHADSPVTIVVGRACQQNVVHPTGAAPRLITNTAVLKKNMKMDENLTGISEIFKTPVTERKRRSLNNTSAMKTPQGTSVVEPSVLNTPEEPGEMVVSPLIVSPAVRGGRYNSEAVQRLLDADQECSFFRDVSPATDTFPDSAQQQGTDLKTTSAQTPGQKPEAPDCLTGVKRIMRTPRQKPEPVEDLRGRLLMTPKQKPEQQECLTAVKRIMKTPRQKAEPVEDLRGKLLKTPRQKVEQQECLSGVKRILETPHQEDKPVDNLEGTLVEAPEAADASCAVVEAIMETSTCAQESEGPSETTNMKTPNTTSSPSERLTAVKRLVKTPKDKDAPVEETVGVKRLVKTPRETIEPVEENFGNEILVKTPILKDKASEEDFQGPQELMEKPLSEPTGQLDPNELEDETTPDCGGDVVKELEFAPEEQKNEAPSDVAEDVPPVSAEEKAGTNEVCTEELSEEAPSDAVSSSDTVETVSQAVEQDLPVEDNKDEAVDVNLSEDPEVDVVEEAASEEQTKMEDSTSRATEIDSAAEEVEQEKKPVRRGRAKTPQSKSAEDKRQAEELSEDRVPSPVRGKRGRRIEAAAPPTPRQSRNKNAKTAESSDADLSVEKNASLTEETPQEAVENIVSGPVQLEVLPSESDENKTVAMETSSQAPQIESLPEVETSTCKVTESAEAATQKKSVRGRKVTVVESKPAEDKEEVRELSEDPVPAPVGGRRGKKSEVATLPPVRHTTRSRRAKPEKSTSNEQPEMVAERAVETSGETENNTEAVIDQTSSVSTHPEEHHSAPPTNEAVIKPTRGRKVKTPVHPPQSEPEKNGDVRDEHLVAEAPPQQSTPAPGKPRRGRKPQADIVEQKEVAEDAAVIVETMQQPPPPVRAKRGRNAKLEEVKPENVEKTQSQELVKTPRRTRKTEQDHVEPQEVQVIEATELVVSEEAEVPIVAVPEKVNEKAPAAVRPTRGRKEKTYPENGTPAESTELQEVPAASSTVKARRGRRGKQVDDEIEVAVLPEEKPDHNLEAGEKSEEPDAAVIKPKRGRKGKLVANEVAVVVPEEKHDHNLEEEEKSEEPDAPVIKPSRRVARNGAALAVPAKKTRRGPAPPPEETDEDSTVLASKPVSASVETAKRGRRAAAKTAAEDTMETSEQANPTDQSSAAVIEDAKKSNRFVKWKNDVEVIEIAKETPVKAVRGRKSKLGDKVDTKSKSESKDAGKTEEKVLSDKVEEAPPTKRARRGVKVADVSAESTSQEKSVEAETLPRTRRGRSAKQ